MVMRNGARIFASLFLGAALPMLISGSRPSCTNDKDALFETDVYGSVGDILKKCSADKKAAFGAYVQSFDHIAKGITPYAPAYDTQPNWDDSTNAAKDILEGWMKRKKKDLRAIFAVIEVAPVVPETCAFQRAPEPFVPGVEQQGFATVVFWVLPTGVKSRHLVEIDPLSPESSRSPSLLGDFAGYDVRYMKATSAMDTLWEQDVKEYVLQKHTDTLRITCDFKKEGVTYTLQMRWNVPAIGFKDQRSLREYLKIMGPAFYAFDADSSRTAFFQRTVENGPVPPPLVNW